MFKPFIIVIGLIFYSFAHVFACQMPAVADIDQQFRLLDTFNKVLEKEKLSYEGVRFLEQNIKKIDAFSKDCIQQEDEKIKNINELNRELSDISDNQLIQKRLSGYKEVLCKHQIRKVLCQSLKLKTQYTSKLSKDAVNQYRDISFNTPSFIESLNLFKLGKLDFSHVKSVHELLNLDYFSSFQLKQLELTFGLGLFFGSLVYLILRWLNKRIKRYYVNRFVHIFGYYALLVAPLILVLAKCTQYFSMMAEKPMIVILLVFIQLVIKTILFIRLFYWLIRLKRSEILLQKFMFWMQLTLTLVMFQMFSYMFFNGFFLSSQVSNLVTQLSMLIFIPLLMFLGSKALNAWINFYYVNLNTRTKLKYKNFGLIFLGLIGFSEFLIVCNRGFNELATNLPILSLIIVFFLWLDLLLFKYLNSIKLQIQNRNGKLSKIIDRYFGKNYHEVFLYFYYIFYLINIIFIFFLFTFLLKGWGMPLAIVDQLDNIIFYGFSFGGYLIKPFFLVEACFMVLIINTFGKLLSIYYSSMVPLDDDKKYTLSILIQGFFYTISLIVVLNMFGMHQDQLSFIMGAFSVGISIALRGVITDFLAGIYLVFQKPVYIGDYIEVNNVEGQVKRITLLTTMLLCPNDTIVYIPNEEFLRKNVFNKSSFKKKIPCSLNFAIKNFNDFDMCRKLILEVLGQYPQVYINRDSSNDVLFNQLKESNNSGYIIKVHFYLNILAERDRILSSIQLEVLRLFKENKLEII